MQQPTNDTRSPLDIPLPYRQLFDAYPSFNALQCSLFNALFASDSSIVLSAPTGSGKTVIFEMAIAKMLQHQHPQENNGILPKAVYVAPIKALCSEKFNDWYKRFNPLGIACCQITGDSSDDVNFDLSALAEAQVIITTPEKWDSMTRRWREYKAVLQAVSLFMIDEVHLLNEDVRGPILEAIVARMKTMQLGTRKTRFVIASATIPNVEDLSQWLKGVRGQDDVTHYKFSEDERPVPLEKHVIAVHSKTVGFRFDLHLNYKLADIIRQYSQRKATLIFCNSRKSAEMSANVLDRNGITSYFFDVSPQKRRQLLDISAELHDAKLSKLVSSGIAYHHAGLSFDDRRQIEDGFRRGSIMILVSTNTLAMGVNLPAHLVVIKSTEYYNRGSFVEYSESTLQQMIGRAGRPQYDTKGIAVILTHTKNVLKYDGCPQPVESHLHRHLAEHLNSEIALKTISNLEMAMQWIRSTFLYVRATKSPRQYGIRVEATDATEQRAGIEKELEAMCVKQIEALLEAGLIERHDETDKWELEITAYGKLMAKYYLTFDTMKLFRNIQGEESLLDTLNVIIRCKEFEEFTLRVNEKKFLNDLNKSLRFPIKGRIKSKEEKILCLIQACLGNLSIPTPALALEAARILRIGERVAKCLLEYLRLSVSAVAHLDSQRLAGGGCYNVVRYAVTVAKCFHAKLWENSVYASKQLRKIGAIYTGLLADAGKTTLKSIGETDAHLIETILGKSHPFGGDVLMNVRSFPEYDLKVLLNEKGNAVSIRVTQLSRDYLGVMKSATNAVVVVGDSNNKLYLFDENLDKTILSNGVFERSIQLEDSEVGEIFIHVLHKLYVSVDVETSVVINAKTLAEAGKKKGGVAGPRKRKHIQTKLPLEYQKTASPSSALLSTSTETFFKERDSSSSDFVTKIPRQSLKTFQFKKSKLHTDNVTTEADKDISTSECLSESSHNSSFSQRKLTDYYLKRRNKPTEKKMLPLDKLRDAVKILESNFTHDSLDISLDQSKPPKAKDNALLNEVSTKSGTSKEAATPKEMAEAKKKTDEQIFDELEACLKLLDERNEQDKCAEDPKDVSFNSLSDERRLFSGFSIGQGHQRDQPNEGDLSKEPPQELTDHSIQNLIDNPKQKASQKSREKTIEHPLDKLLGPLDDSLDISLGNLLNDEVAEDPLESRHREAFKSPAPKENDAEGTKTDVEDPCAHWYKVCRAFMRLKPYHQNYTNFQRISQRQSSKSKAPKRNLLASTPLDSNEAVAAFKPDHETSFSTIAKVPAASQNLNTTVTSVGRSQNPYRLQIFKEPEGNPAVNQTFDGRESVNNINRNVMVDLLRAKTQEYQEEAEEAVTAEGGEALLREESERPADVRQKKLEDFKSFEDYCEYYLKMDQMG